MVTATVLRVPGTRSAVISSTEHLQRSAYRLVCSRPAQSAAHRQTAQRVKPLAAARQSAELQSHSRPGAFLRSARIHEARSSRTAAQAATDDSADAPRSSTQALGRSAGGFRTWLAELFNSPFDADIFNVAVPALGSILLDAVMLLVDTGDNRAAQTLCSFLQASAGRATSLFRRLETRLHRYSATA